MRRIIVWTRRVGAGNGRRGRETGLAVGGRPAVVVAFGGGLVAGEAEGGAGAVQGHLDLLDVVSPLDMNRFEGCCSVQQLHC